MCGRYVLTEDLSELAAEFYAQLDPTLSEREYRANYNVAPGVNIPVIAAISGVRRLTEVRWGIIPKWGRGSSTSLINARGESVYEKVTFKEAFATCRILIPATGYYEWKRPEKDPYFISPSVGEPHTVSTSTSTLTPMAMAGLISESVINGQVLPTCAIITLAAAPNLESIHDRMPACVDASNWDMWFDPSIGAQVAMGLLVARLDLRAFRVDRKVNSVRNNALTLIEELTMWD